ncbi:MAG: hypothetical protein AAFX76_02980 [Planctomycetota bacterium]
MVPQTQIPYAETIDVAPTVAAIMGVEPPSDDGGSGRVLTSVLPGGAPLEHPRHLERINGQILAYEKLRAQATLRAFDDPTLNMLLMELDHGGLSEHQFYHSHRLMEWHQAGSLEHMIESNAWVLETLRLALEDSRYRLADW